MCICLNQFPIDTSVFAISMHFAHRYINMRSIIYVYISDFVEQRGLNLSSNVFNESFFRFNPQIKTTGILVCPSFARCS